MKQLFLLFLNAVALSGCATPTQMVLDAEVKRLCAIDGGIKVYETVTLPAEKFNQWGQVDFYRPTQGEEALGNEYRFKKEDFYYLQGNPSMFRTHAQIFRQSDKKLLGEAIFYTRGGGDMHGPWYGTGFYCPSHEYGYEHLFKKIFLIEGLSK